MNWKNKLTAEFIISVFYFITAILVGEQKEPYYLIVAMIFLAAHGIIIEVRKSNDYKQTT